MAQLRQECTGPRGKSAFAKQLGLSASTYDYYEADRVPPADVLVKVSDLTGVNLRWLLTGKGPRTSSATQSQHPTIRRAAELLAANADAAPALAAFLDILEAAATFPAKGAAPAATPAERAVGSAAVRLTWPGPLGSQPPVPLASETAGARATWIPVLGRTAAGVPQFWADKDEAATVTTLQEIVSRHAANSVQTAPATVESIASAQDAESVQRITLRETGPDNVCEFLAADKLKARHHDAFALRIDGDSMAPEFRHGDLVLLSPSVGAEEGKPAVVQLENQIGVTCKLYRRVGGRVHLVPVNGQYPVQTFPQEQVVWALGVLARVR